MPELNYEELRLVGPSEQGGMPPGLNTADPPTDLRSDETPDGYGYDLDVDGKIKTGTIPSGTSRVLKPVSIGGSDYFWAYRRLWRINGSTLEIGAPNIDAAYFQQGPDMPFNEDAQSIVAIQPFGIDLMAVAKSTGSYLLTNASDSRGTDFFQRSDIWQVLAASSANRLVEFDNNLYVSNANGLRIQTQDGRNIDATRKVRDSLTNFADKDLTVAYGKRRIIGGTDFVYDIDTEKLFSYATAGFRFTTRQFHMPDYAPFSIARIIFVIEHGAATDGTLKYQVKLEDEAWGEEKTVKLQNTGNKFTRIPEGLETGDRSSRKWQLRITSLADDKYIKEIWIDHTGFDADGYSK